MPRRKEEGGRERCQEGRKEERKKRTSKKKGMDRCECLRLLYYLPLFFYVEGSDK